MPFWPKSYYWPTSYFWQNSHIWPQSIFWPWRTWSNLASYTLNNLYPILFGYLDLPIQNIGRPKYRFIGQALWLECVDFENITHWSNPFDIIFKYLLLSFQNYEFAGLIFSGLSSTSLKVHFQVWNNISIRMSHWRHTMVNGTEFWITCKRLKLLRKAGRLQLIQNSAPSTIVWRQCDIRMDQR